MTSLAERLSSYGASLVDKALLRAMSRGRAPKVADLSRVRDEIDATHALYERRGYLASREGTLGGGARGGPSGSFHPEPSPIRPTYAHARMRGIDFQWLTFDSEYAVDDDDAVGRRWVERHPKNRTAHAALVRRGGARPWLICLHGLGTGHPWVDFPSFHAARLHFKLGYDLLFPVLPFHGARRDEGVARGSLVSFDVLHNVHGMRQSISEVRRLVRFARSQGATAVGLYGQSVGAYVASAVATLEDVDLVLAGIPLADLPTLFATHADPESLRCGDEHGLLGERAQSLYRLVSPLAGPPRVPHHRRFLYAGRVDAITTPAQAERLWEWWERPSIHWFSGGHVTFFWSRAVDRYVESSLQTLASESRVS